MFSLLLTSSQPSISGSYGAGLIYFLEIDYPEMDEKRGDRYFSVEEVFL
jgi:hypothetical protein